MKRFTLRINDSNDEKINFFLSNRKDLKDQSKNDLINQIISIFFSELPDKEINFKQFLLTGRERTVTKRITLTKSELAILEEFAKLNGHTVTKEIIFRLIGTFSKEPTISEKEIDVFFKFTIAISSVGRNLNQIARQMNSNIVDFNLNQDLKNDINQLKILLNILIDKSNEFMVRATERWYYEKI